MGRAFASRRRAVMTTRTGASDSGMVKVYRGPVRSDVTIFTHISGRQMSSALTGRRRAIMTTRTGAGDSGMVKVHRSPVGGDVAVLTGVGCL